MGKTVNDEYTICSAFYSLGTLFPIINIDGGQERFSNRGPPIISLWGSRRRFLIDYW